MTSKAVPSVLASSVCWSLQCLISALTQGGRWWTLFLSSLVQLHYGEGGMLQTNNTGMCLQCLRHTGPAPAYGSCALPAHTAQALGCSAQEPSEADPGLCPLPRSKPLRFRHSGSPQRCRLGWACVLCLSLVRADQVMRCLVNAVAVTYHLSHPYHLVFWVCYRHSFSSRCRLFRTPRSLSKEACLQFGR